MMKEFWLRVIVLILAFKASNAQDYDSRVRMVDTDGVINSGCGRVEVYINNTWGTVCNREWDDIDAKVVCRQLNFSTDNVIDSNAVGLAEGVIWFSDVQCLGNETSLLDCPNGGLGVLDDVSCGHITDAGVNCLAVCDPPSIPLNGLSLSFTGVSIGDTATYTCAPGYDPVGNGEAICNDRQSKLIVFDPTIECIPQCSPPANPGPNGAVDYSGLSEGDTATYTCDSGFDLFGDETATCTVMDANNGTFLPATPNCLPRCTIPGNPNNGDMFVSSGESINNTATYSCDSDFEPAGRGTVTCTFIDENTAMFLPVPNCIPLCPSPADLTNGLATLTGHSIGDIVTYSCDSRLVLLGNGNATCVMIDENTAAFLPAAPSCTYDFLSFGSQHGDELLMEYAIDVEAGPLVMPNNITCPFFGMEEDTIYVNSNGMISFRQPFNDFLSRPFPLSINDSHIIIAPYWDEFVSLYAPIYYRYSTDDSLLHHIGAIVDNAFVHECCFNPDLLFIATWYKASSWVYSNSENTFQVIMATDGDKTFVLFLYGDIQWSSSNDLRRVYPPHNTSIGFNAGDGVHGFSLALPVPLVDVETASNIGVPGNYIFRVDQGTITEPIIVVRLRPLSGPVSEDVGDIQFEVEVITGVFQYDIPVQIWTIEGTATADLDYSVAQYNFTLSHTHQRHYFNISILEDSNLEKNETFSVILIAPNTDSMNVELEGPEINVTINDNNYAVLGFESDYVEAFEGDIVRLSVGTSGVFLDLVVDISFNTLPGTAKAGVDYVPVSTLLPFSGNEVIVNVTLLQNGIIESENLTLFGSLSLNDTPSNLELGIANVTIVILDNSVTPIGLTSSTLIAIGVLSVVAAILLLIVMLVIILIVYFRRKVKKASLSLKMDDSPAVSDLKSEEHELLRMAVRKSMRKRVSECSIIDSCNLQLNEPVGQGEFGIVYKGKMSQGFNKAFSQTIAVKTLKGFLEKKLIEDLLHECAKMSTFDHPNVLTLVGVCLDGGPAPYIIMPFMFNGSLLSYLKKNRDDLVLPPQQEMDTNVIIVTSKLIDMCLQVAKGMEYLANKKVIHRDLAARNCMIDMNFVIKVADFGLSVSVDPSKDYFRHNTTSAVKLPVKWLAPECLSDGVFSVKSDVWAYGVTCWEVFSGGKMPYSGLNPVELPRMLDKGYRMKKPDNAACPDNMFDIVTQCWSGRAESRPTFSEIVTLKSKFLESLSGYTVLSMEQGELKE